jgi:hypothetical protein
LKYFVSARYTTTPPGSTTKLKRSRRPSPSLRHGRCSAPEMDVCVPPRLASNLLALIGILPLTRVWPTSCTLEMLEPQVSRHSTSSTKVDSAGVRYLDCRWSRVVRQRQWAEGVDTSPLWTMDLVFVSKRTNGLCVRALACSNTRLGPEPRMCCGLGHLEVAKVGCGL